MMTDRKEKRYVSCPVCGRILMKCQGQCNIEITCGKCNKEIVALVDEERVIVLENRRGTGKDGRTGQVRVSVPKRAENGACEEGIQFLN
jgi:phage FluMu protein Com